MELRRLGLVLGLAVAASFVSHGAMAADDEAKQLKDKAVAVPYSLKTTEPASAIDTGGAMIYVNAPIATVRKIVQDYGHYNQLVKPFEQSRVLKKNKGTSEVYVSVPVMHGALTIWAVTTMPPPVKDGDGEKIVGHYEKGNLGDFRATWRLRSVDADHTILKLEVMVDPKLPLPTKAITDECKGAAEKAVTAVRDRAQQTNAGTTQPVATVASNTTTTNEGDKKTAPAPDTKTK